MQFDLFDTECNQILECPTYEAFKQALSSSNCTRCSLSQSRTRIVVDRGNPRARIAMIGEAPGENEDLQGQAFVGKAGQLLDELMKGIGLDTNRDCLIINVVKCRPPGNRAPLKEEVAACTPFLKRQLALAEPELIVLLGATALKHILPTKGEISMEKEAGTFFTHPDYPSVQFVVLYHPAFLLYDARKKPVMVQHLRKLKEFLQKK